MSPQSHDALKAWLAERDAEMAAALQRVRGRYRADRLSQPPTAHRKITSAAENRMLSRAAREQHADAMAELQRGPEDAVPDADNGAAWSGVMR